MATHPARWGGKIGPRIAMLVSQAIVFTHAKLAALKHKVAMAVFHSISDEISQEVDITLGPIFEKLHNALDTDHPAYPAVHFMHTVHGQLKALVGTGVQMSGLIGTVSSILNNELAPVVYTFIAQNPHSIPPVPDLASMAAIGAISDEEAIANMASNGYDAGWAANYVRLGRSYPSVDIGLELLRRGLLSEQDLNVIFAESGLPNEYWGPMLATRNGPVSVADAALAVLRGDVSFDEGATLAAQNGYSLDSFKLLIGNTGEPLGLEQLLEAYRRGFIDKQRLERGILQSRTRDEWIDVAERLRYSPMSVSDAVNAVVQDQMDMATGEKTAEENGLEPGSFSILYNTAGEPLSRTEMEQLYNRGLVTEDQVKQALRESRLKNKYVDQAFLLHQRILPESMLPRAIRYGTLTEAQAVAAAMESGYSKQDAATIVGSGVAERIQVYKDRIVSSVLTLYEDNIISAAQAGSAIEGVGHTPAEASFIVRSAEYKRESKLVSQVIAVTRSKYLSRHITKNQAIGAIDATGVPAQERDNLLQLWDIEHAAYTRELTEAQVVKAVKLNLISADDGGARLVNMGYTASDAALLIAGA